MVFTFTVVSANVEHAGAPWRDLADICGWQEADKPRWWEKVDRRLRFKPAKAASLAVGITWRDGWRQVAAGCEGPIEGRAGVAPHRYVTWVVLRHSSGFRVAEVNTHATKPDGVIPAPAYRAESWEETQDLIERVVARLRAQGLPVILTGDFNRHRALVRIDGMRHVAPKTRTKRVRRRGRRVLVTLPAIDHILVSDDLELVGEPVHLDAEGSDHKPARVQLAPAGTQPPQPVPTPDPEDPVTDDRYEKTTYGDTTPKTVDRMTAQALDLAAARLGYTLTVYQGSYNTTVKASAKTHWGGGVVDLAPFDQERKVRVLREIGFAAWYRPKTSDWDPHIHAVLIGNERAHQQALDQVAAYRRGENGLANRGPDTEWRPKVIKAFKYTPPPPPSRVSVYRDRLEAWLKEGDELFADIRPHITAKERPAADRMLKAIAAGVRLIRAALANGPKS